jgi:lipoprotein-anchoring transpeptidase ErfK/SrfK
MKQLEAIAEALLVLSTAILIANLPHPSATAAKPSAALQPQTIPAAAPTTKTSPAPAVKPQPKTATAEPPLDAHTRTIVVSLEDRRLALIEDGQLKKVYTVAVGKDSTPSPTGTFTIVRRVANPTYYHDGKIIPPGRGNPVGTRWMGLSKPGYGIHGTNAPKSIGKAASHGCIRMSQPDLEDLFTQVRSGDTVEILGTRNQETAALFGTPIVPATANMPSETVLAQAAPQPATQPDATSTAAVSAVTPAAVALAQ